MRSLPLLCIFVAIIFFAGLANLTRRTWQQRLAICSIAFYLIVLDVLCFTPSNLSIAGFAQYHPIWIGSAPTNFIPFKGIAGDFFLNILMTVPLGVYFGLFAIKPSLKGSLRLGLMTGLTIESLQFIADVLVDIRRWVDINDVITNCLGVIVGYGVFKLMTKLVPRVVRSFEM